LGIASSENPELFLGDGRFAGSGQNLAEHTINGHAKILFSVWLWTQVLNAREKVARGKMWSLDLEISTGKAQEIKIVKAEVSRSIHNKFELHSSKVS